MTGNNLLIAEFEKSKASNKKRLRTNRNAVFVINNVSKLYSQLDVAVEDSRNKATNKFDCKKGCSSCCSLRVEVLAPEAFYIAKQLVQTKGFDRASVIDSLQKQADYAKGKTKEEYFHSCAFLGEGVCTIYEIRPFMCRKLLSFDVRACESEERNPPESSELVAKSQGLGLGFSEAYAHYKYQSSPTEFSQALLKVLTNDSLIESWMKGEPVFAPLP